MGSMLGGNFFRRCFRSVEPPGFPGDAVVFSDCLDIGRDGRCGMAGLGIENGATGAGGVEEGMNAAVETGPDTVDAGRMTCLGEVEAELSIPVFSWDAVACGDDATIPSICNAGGKCGA